MKHTLPVILIWLVALTTMGGAPANDAFADRFFLAGSSVQFTGTLVGATFEPFEIPGHCDEFFIDQSGSVWWEWTASDTATVIVEVVDCSTNAFRYGGMMIIRGTNAIPCEGDCDVVYVGCTPFDTGRRSYATFTATAGEKFQIQVIGPPVGSFTLKLTATNRPHFVVHPITQSVSSGGSVFFGGWAAGTAFTNYQWRRNGVDLPGKNAATVLLSHLTTDQAGEYTLVASNAFGTTVSEPARLHIGVSDIQPALKLHRVDGRLILGVVGETGRTYRIEFSTNLTTWNREVSFHDSRNYLLRANQMTDVVFNTNGIADFALPQQTQSKFFRAYRYASEDEECTTYLKRMRFAKELWALKNRRTSSGFPTPDELTPFLGESPFAAPDGYWYVVFDMGTLPICGRLPNHKIEEPEY